MAAPRETFAHAVKRRGHACLALALDLALAWGLGTPHARWLGAPLAPWRGVAFAEEEPGVASATPASTANPGYQARHFYQATSRRSFEDVEQWKRVFDDPARDAWQKPGEVVRALGLRPGMWVADLGAGTGYFSGYLSAAVGPTGAVLAIDTEPNLVSHLRERAGKEALENVTPILASPDNPRLPPGATDLVLVVDTFHHIDDRLAYFRRLARCLKPGGRIAIIDWLEGDLPVGPPPDHKLSREQVIEEMRAAGYVLAEEPDILPYQYFLVFKAR